MVPFRDCSFQHLNLLSDVIVLFWCVDYEQFNHFIWIFGDINFLHIIATYTFSRAWLFLQQFQSVWIWSGLIAVEQNLRIVKVFYSANMVNMVVWEYALLGNGREMGTALKFSRSSSSKVIQFKYFNRPIVLYIIIS